MVDQEPTLRFDYSNHKFVTPVKNLVTVPHIELFKSSNGCKELVGFINALTESVKNSKMTETQLTDVSTNFKNSMLFCEESNTIVSIS